jgi:hypothetical protein
MDAAVALAPADISSYPTVFDPKTLVRKGLCPVTKIASKTKNRTETSPSLTEALPESHTQYFEASFHNLYPSSLIEVLDSWRRSSEISANTRVPSASQINYKPR